MTSASLDLSDTVDTYGWAVMKVGDDAEGPGFAYTIGLFHSFRHPEIVIFGLPGGVMHQILNDIGELVRQGTVFSAGKRSPDVLSGYDVEFREVARAAYGRYLGGAIRFYVSDAFPALHCLWPDREGRFPWEPGAPLAFRRLQPMLSDGPEAWTSVRPPDH